MKEEEIKIKKTHKLEIGDKIKIWRKDWQGKTFYNVRLNQKQYDGTFLNWYCPVNFRKGIELQNGDLIIINKMIENLIENKKDKYHPIHSYMILEFTKIETDEQKYNNAKKEYNQEIENIKEETTNEVEIDESCLPF